MSDHYPVATIFIGAMCYMVVVLAVTLMHESPEIPTNKTLALGIFWPIGLMIAILCGLWSAIKHIPWLWEGMIMWLPRSEHVELPKAQIFHVPNVREEEGRKDGTWI